MTEVIYADILLIVNIYVNYVLLKISACFLKREISAYRVLLASFIGGLYAFIILADTLPFYVIAFSRLAAALFITFVSFGYKSFKIYIRSVLMFLLASFMFAGLMYFLWTFFAPPVMAFRNSVVYFDIDAFDLCVMTIICYSFLKLFDIILQSRQTENVIYEVCIYIDGEEFLLKALLDTGNSLSEPFSGYPVIIADGTNKSEGKETQLSCVIEREDIPKRFVLCNTINSSSLLCSFRPEKIRVKGIDVDFETDKVYVALTNNKIRGGEFGALLGCSVFEGKTTESEKDYRKQTV